MAREVKKPTAAKPTKKATPAPVDHPLVTWLTASRTEIGRHLHLALAERSNQRASVIEELRRIIKCHYVAPETTLKRLAELGAPKTARLIREYIPKGRRARSGDLGEIFATEVAEQFLNFNVPIRRLRWKDDREMALRGDDLVGLSEDEKGRLRILKGESKSRAKLTTTTVSQAGKTLDNGRGRPGPHSVLFVAQRLREMNKDNLALLLELAVESSFRGTEVSHFLFTLSGNCPDALLTKHLNLARKKVRKRHAVGLTISDHALFVKNLYDGI